MPPHDHAGRRARLAARLSADDVDGLLVTSPIHVRWLTGFSGSNSALFVPADPTEARVSALLATDGRYTAQASVEVPDLSVLITRRCAPALLEQLGGAGIARIGVEAAHLSVADFDELRRVTPGIDLVPTSTRVEELRVVKEPGELALLAAACAISTSALEYVVESGGWSGSSERELAGRLEAAMRQRGSDGTAFETIVGTGANSAVPHHRPGDRILERGDLVVIDFGARVGGYHADITRTFVLGRPAPWQVDLHELVRSAQRAGRGALAPGAPCADVDRAARGVVEAAGHGAEFVHGLGHGVGLEIHEAPFLGPGATGSVRADVPVTVEPGVYLPGRGGVRIEDTVVVTDTGPTVLTTTSRDLIALD
jgi:Xaa-Pro aminopeptidase